MKPKLLLLFTCLLLSSVGGYAQRKLGLAQALGEITRVYGTKFSYEEGLFGTVQINSDLLPKNKTKSVESLLKDILYPNGFLFLYVQNNYYTIIRDNQKQGGEQTDTYWRVISGQVKGSNGQPLTGVTVMPDGIGVRTGVSTSSDGSYTLRLREPAEAIVFSFIGMEPQRRVIGKNSQINVSMGDAVNQLEEVEVVSTGYQKISKERATGAFGQITSKELKEVPAVNLLERIEGTIPGVQVDLRTNELTVRGINSFNTDGNSRRPLIVVDGFPAIEQNLVENTTQFANNSILNKFNPADIESITVLKDAAAASIWGAQAANGVIVIETKKGRVSDPTISFSTNLSISAPADLSNINRMSSRDYVELEKELFSLGFVPDPDNWYYDPVWTPFNPNMPASEAVQWMFKAKRNEITQNELDVQLERLSNVNNFSQIRKNLLQNAVSQQYNLSLSGGNARTTYMVSGNYSDDVPVFKSNRGQTFFVNSNLTTNFLNQRLKLTTGINYNYAKSSSNQVAANALGNNPEALRPYELLKDDNGNLVRKSLKFTDPVLADFYSRGLYDWTYNPIEELNYNNYTMGDNRFRINAQLDGKINSWAGLSLSGMLQRTLAETTQLDELKSYSMRDFLNYATTVDFENNSFTRNLPQGGRMLLRNENSTMYNVRLQGNVDKSWWQDKVNLNVIAGAEISSQTGINYAQTRYGFNEDTYSSVNYDQNGSYMGIQGWEQSIGVSDGTIGRPNVRKLSYYSNAALSFLKGRYIVSGSARFDDMTLIGISREKRAKPIWSSGVKWNIKSERFLSEQNWLNALNLRVTYGVGGTLPSGGSNVTVIDLQGPDGQTGEIPAVISAPRNPEVGWERVYTQNYGLDFTILDNRLSVNFDLYKKHTKDILYNFPFNSTYGWSSVQFNGGTMESNGIDLGVSGRIVQNNNFRWQSIFNFSYNTNKVTDSRFQITDISQYIYGSLLGGMPVDYLYAYKWAGLDETGQSQIAKANGEIVKSTQGGRNIFAREDLVYMGRTTAPYFGGFMNNFTYKGVNLGVRISYEMGHVRRLQSFNNYPQYQGVQYGILGTNELMVQRWRNPGDEANTDVPGLKNINTNSYNRFRDSENLIIDAGHIRLQQISLGYSFPSSFTAKTPFKSLGINAAVRNLGILWKANKMGVDPMYVRNNSYNNLAPTKNYFLTIDASF